MAGDKKREIVKGIKSSVLSLKWIPIVRNSIFFSSKMYVVSAGALQQHSNTMYDEYPKALHHSTPPLIRSLNSKSASQEQRHFFHVSS